MIREILLRYVGTATKNSTEETSTLPSTTSTEGPMPSYGDILDARRHALRWEHQSARITDLIEQTEQKINQLAVDRRLAYEMKQMSRLATLDSDRLEEEARLKELLKLLYLLTGSSSRDHAEALTQQVHIALRVTYELENAWLQMKELVLIATVNGFPVGDLTKETAEYRVEQARKDFYTSVAQLVLHLNAASPLSAQEKVS